MKHEEIRHTLSEFIDGAITPGEKAIIEQHLMTCTECANALRELRKTIEHIHAVEAIESPAWMTKKIMAKVREEQEAEKGLWQRVFAPFFMKFPVQAVAVLFLSVTAFYIFTTMHPAEKYTEAPMERFAKQEAHDASRDAPKHKAPEITEHREKKVAQGPDYKSLDMKYEYEKPAPPVPQDRTVSSAPAPGKLADKTLKAPVVDSKDIYALSPKSVSPLMAEQAAPSAGAVLQSTAKRKAASEERNAKSSLAADREADALLDVTEHFVKVDLPETMKKMGLQYHIRKFESGLADLGWMRETNAYRSKLCTSRYVVDVDLSGKLSKYLYCYDRSQITLLGIYEFKDGTWSEIK